MGQISDRVFPVNVERQIGARAVLARSEIGETAVWRTVTFRLRGSSCSGSAEPDRGCPLEATTVACRPKSHGVEAAFVGADQRLDLLGVPAGTGSASSCARCIC